MPRHQHQIIEAGNGLKGHGEVSYIIIWSWSTRAGGKIET